MRAPALAIAVAALLPACGGTKPGSRSSASAASSAGASSSGGGMGSSGSPGSTSLSSSSGAGSIGGSIGTGSTGGSGTSGFCYDLGQYAGAPGPTPLCCSGQADSLGYCIDPNAASTSGSGSGGGSSGSSSGGSLGGTSGTSGANLCSTQRCVVFAETATDLYQVDPVTLTQQHLCSFSGLGGSEVWDMAVRPDGRIYALTPTALYEVNPTTCAATFLVSVPSASSDFNGLSFTPTGTLIAASRSGDISIIDPTTGTVTPAGSYGGNLGSSGDLVTLSNGAIYATAWDKSGQAGSDLLVTLDPVTYAASMVGPIGFSGIWGLGFWAGTLYGFDFLGNVLRIDPATGAGTVLQANASLSWYGAGTTPQAPILDH